MAPAGLVSALLKNIDPTCLNISNATAAIIAAWNAERRGTLVRGRYAINQKQSTKLATTPSRIAMTFNSGANARLWSIRRNERTWWLTPDDPRTAIAAAKEKIKNSSTKPSRSLSFIMTALPRVGSIFHILDTPYRRLFNHPSPDHTAVKAPKPAMVPRCEIATSMILFTDSPISPLTIREIYCCTCST